MKVIIIKLIGIIVFNQLYLLVAIMIKYICNHIEMTVIIPPLMKESIHNVSSIHMLY